MFTRTHRTAWPKGPPPSSIRAASTALLIVVAALGVNGCGGSDPRAPGPVTPADVTQTVRLSYSSQDLPDHGSRTIPVTLGKIVYLHVSSDVAGRLRLQGYGLARHVTGGKNTVLTFSADRAGIFDVRMQTVSKSVRVAQLDVRRK
jgi:hypothetical protein